MNWAAVILVVLLLAGIACLVLWLLGVFDKKCTSYADCKDVKGKHYCKIEDGDETGKCKACTADENCSGNGANTSCNKETGECVAPPA